MNFEFSADQKLIQEQARHFLSEQSPLTRARDVIDTERPYDANLWQSIAELGWMGTAIPEQYGGLGMGPLELCVIAEELGRALTPIPFYSNVYLAAELLLLTGSDAQKTTHLPTIADGSVLFCLAVAEAPGQSILSTQSCTVRDNKISGRKIAVLDGIGADQAIVSALDSDGNDTLYLVALDQAGVTRSAAKSIDPTRPMATLQFDAVGAEPLGDKGDTANAALLLEQLFTRTAVLTSFEQIGGCDAVMQMGMDYGKQRFAFGRPIASFQAIKHLFANMYVATELARSNAYYAAWALHTNAEELPLAAATARVSAIDAYYFCSKENIEAHGGMGFTWEFDCHLYYKRAQLLSSSIGSSRWWREKLVTTLLEAS